ncbi:hypothetical protein Mia14_0369 [Candidatus Mancarchaeum acidiphilum]|uniref:Uncharacterized protein n=1 Tax=Candidatus Mancarchaeum acidiphilum TaxID=1920749 RepID=A0A218NML0_9ARCH|nr:hypothetical protein [Candidatus Mancarchaeum acidiphilum]ASI13691.1 hypothetical protein Mia14_0369 [Candidatus Mancarchaeum acidiphilum]
MIGNTMTKDYNNRDNETLTSKDSYINLRTTVRKAYEERNKVELNKQLAERTKVYLKAKSIAEDLGKTDYIGSLPKGLFLRGTKYKSYRTDDFEIKLDTSTYEITIKDSRSKIVFEGKGLSAMETDFYKPSVKLNKFLSKAMESANLIRLKKQLKY